MKGANTVQRTNLLWNNRLKHLIIEITSNEIYASIKYYLQYSFDNLIVYPVEPTVDELVRRIQGTMHRFLCLLYSQQFLINQFSSLLRILNNVKNHACS